MSHDCHMTHMSTPKELGVLGQIEFFQFLLTELIDLSTEVLLDLA